MDIYHLSCASLPELSRYDQQSVDAGLDHSLISVSFFNEQLTTSFPQPMDSFCYSSHFTPSPYSLSITPTYLFHVTHTILLHFTTYHTQLLPPTCTSLLPFHNYTWSRHPSFHPYTSSCPTDSGSLCTCSGYHVNINSVLHGGC